MAVTLDVYDADDLTSKLGDIDEATRIRWTRDRLDLGDGKFTAPHTANGGLLAAGNLVKVLDDGTVVAGWRMTRPSRQPGDAVQPVTIRGLDLTGTLAEGVVYPAGGLDQPLLSDVRVFGWMTADYDDSAWEDGDTIASLGTQDAPTPGNFVGNPPDWPDPTAEWMWTEAPTGDPLRQPAGTVYFRRTLEIDGEPAGGPARIYVSGVNRWDVWLDGRQLGSGGSHQEMATFDVELVDGTDHVIALRAVNVTRPATHTGQNVGAVLVTIRRLDDDGNPGSVFYRSYVNGPPGPEAGREPSWRGLGYPASVPGVTIGYILATLFDEAKDRGCFTGITRDFDADTDSAGVAWPQEIEFAVQVGNDSILTVAERLRHYGIDFVIDPATLTFHVWSDRGVDRGATPDPGVSTVTVPLDRATDKTVPETEWDDVNALLVRSSDTWLQRPDPGPASHRRERFLSLGLTPSAGSAASIGDDTLAEPDPWAVTWDINSGTDNVPTPGVDFDEGDIIRGPWLASITADWALADVRVDRITGEVQTAGDITWTCEVSAP